jgi:hypothetical protein
MISAVEAVLWYNFQRYCQAREAQVPAAKHYDLIALSRLDTQSLRIIFQRQRASLIELNNAMTRALDAFNEAHTALEGLYAQHSGCACREPKAE